MTLREEKAAKVEKAARALLGTDIGHEWTGTGTSEEAGVNALRAALALPVEEPAAAPRGRCPCCGGSLAPFLRGGKHWVRCRGDAPGRAGCHGDWPAVYPEELPATIYPDDGQGHRLPEETVTLREDPPGEGATQGGTCPECDGRGGRQVGLGRPDASGDEEWEIESCDACEGTGRSPVPREETK